MEQSVKLYTIYIVWLFRCLNYLRDMRLMALQLNSKIDHVNILII